MRGEQFYGGENRKNFCGATTKIQKVYVHFLCLQKRLFLAGVRIPAILHFRLTLFNFSAAIAANFCPSIIWDKKTPLYRVLDLTFYKLWIKLQFPQL